MAKYHDIDADIWEDLLEFGAKQKLVFIYLFSNPLCRPSGLYRIRIETIKHHTKCTAEDLESIRGRLIEFDPETSEVWVRGKMKRILSGFRNNVKMQQSIRTDYDELKSPIIKESFYQKYKGALEGLVSPPLTLPLALPLPEKDRGVGKEKPKPAAFEVFWETYPKKRSKGKAEKAWNAIKPNEQLQDRMLRAIERAKTSDGWKKDNGEFIPYPATWLNARGWEDEHYIKLEPKKEPKKADPKCDVCSGTGKLPDRQSVPCFCCR